MTTTATVIMGINTTGNAREDSSESGGFVHSDISTVTPETLKGANYYVNLISRASL